ncbi:hypothetical protein RU639_008361 [Aspergillus parasiticus]
MEQLLAVRRFLRRLKPAVGIRDNTTATSTALGPKLGVNGIRVFDGYLYYVNPPQKSFYHVRLDESGNTVGQPETIVQGVFADDFAVTSSGAYLVELTNNVIINVSLNGEAHVVTGGKELDCGDDGDVGRCWAEDQKPPCYTYSEE